MHAKSTIALLTVGFTAIALAAYASRSATLPDAVIARIEVRGSNLREGDSVPVRVEVANRGDAPLPPVPVLLVVDDEPYAEWKPTAAISPSKSATWSLTWHATRGSHVLAATVDPLNDVAESDEANNSAFVNVGVEQAAEPTPWRAAAAGVAAIAVGVVTAAAVARLRPRPRAGQRHSVGKPQSKP